MFTAKFGQLFAQRSPFSYSQMINYKYTSSIFAVNQLMFSNMQQRSYVTATRAQKFKQVIDAKKRNQKFSNFHFVKIPSKQFSDFKGSSQFHQRKENFKSEPLDQQLPLDIDESQKKINIESFNADELACASMNEQMYDNLKSFQAEETHFEKNQKIDLYKKQKLASIEQNEIKPLDQNLFDEKVTQLFENLEMSIQDLQEKQALSENSVEISHMFANEINLKVQNTKMTYINGSFSETVNEVANLTIYCDSQCQMVIVDSSLSGPQYFEYNNQYKMWMSPNNEFYVQSFLQQELQNHTTGLMEIK